MALACASAATRLVLSITIMALRLLAKLHTEDCDIQGRIRHTTASGGAAPVSPAHDHRRPHWGRGHGQHGQDEPGGAGMLGIKAQRLDVLIADARQDLVGLLSRDLLQPRQKASGEDLCLRCVLCLCLQTQAGPPQALLQHFDRVR